MNVTCISYISLFVVILFLIFGLYTQVQKYKKFRPHTIPSDFENLYAGSRWPAFAATYPFYAIPPKGIVVCYPGCKCSVPYDCDGPCPFTFLCKGR